MKKNLLWVALAAITMASCTSDELSVADKQNQEATAQGLMPVNLSLSTSAASVTETRSTGTVGDSTAAQNAFHFEDIYVLMMDVTGTAGHPWGYSDCGGTLGTQFDNTFFCRPQEGTTPGVYSLEYNGPFDGDAGGALKYYPMNGVSNFFAYYIDDAANQIDVNGVGVVDKFDANGEIDSLNYYNDAKRPAGNPVLEIGTDAYKLPFTLNGKQDIMAGIAKNTIRNQADTEDSIVVEYSNKTARVPIVPQIDMKHMLTRLTFEIVAGDNLNNTMFIDSIGVTSQYKGKLTVATKDTADYQVDNLIEWDGNGDIDTLYLNKLSSVAATFTTGKQQTENIDTIFLDQKDDTYPVGDALFVKPNETTYTLKLKLHQNVTGLTGTEEQTQVARIPITRGGLTFERGKSYHVKVTVYGMHEIVLTATLEKWDFGGEIEVDTDMSE